MEDEKMKPDRLSGLLFALLDLFALTTIRLPVFFRTAAHDARCIVVMEDHFL